MLQAVGDFGGKLLSIRIPRRERRSPDVLSDHTLAIRNLYAAPAHANMKQGLPTQE